MRVTRVPFFLVVLINTCFFFFLFQDPDGRESRNRLRSLSSDSAGKLDILGHDGHSLGVDGAKIGVLEESNQVSLSSLLQSKDGRSLEAKIALVVLGDLTNKALEGQLADEELSGLLVSSDLSESYGTRAEAVGLLDTSGGGGRLASCLGGELLSGGLASG